MNAYGTFALLLSGPLPAGLARYRHFVGFQHGFPLDGGQSLDIDAPFVGVRSTWVTGINQIKIVGLYMNTAFRFLATSLNSRSERQFTVLKFGGRDWNARARVLLWGRYKF